MNITWRGSPNFDKNRKTIDRIVIHWFGVGTLESAHARFQTVGNSSAHYGISGSRIWQWVKEEHVAYHAGNYAMNQRSIGIEHDAGIDPKHDLSEESYRTSAELIAYLSKKYNIPLDRNHIIGHNEVKATQCPGTIDINRLITLAKEYGSSNMSDDEKRALEVLKNAVLTLKTSDGTPFGNIEGMTRALVAYYQAPPQIKEVIKEVPVTVEKIVEVEKEIIKEVPVEIVKKEYVTELKNPVANFFLKLAMFAEG